jgi:hypothetical protein
MLLLEEHQRYHRWNIFRGRSNILLPGGLMQAISDTPEQTPQDPGSGAPPGTRTPGIQRRSRTG